MPSLPPAVPAVRFARIARTLTVAACALLVRAPAAWAQQDTTPPAAAAPAVAAAAAAAPAGANTDTVYAVRLRDGSTVLGRIEDPAADPIVIATAHGVLRIRRSEVAEVTRISSSSMRDGEYWPPSPNDSRLLFAPTGRMLRRGDGYFSNTYLFVQHLAGGISNRFTLGAGMSLIPGLDINQNIFYVTPKLGVYNSERTNVAVGVLAGYLPGEDSDYDPQYDDPGTSFGILYGVSTFGSPDGHVTLGGGLGYVNSDLGEDPILMIGGEKRVARRASLVTENYLFPTAPDFNNVVSYGVRFFGEKLSVDLAFFNTLGESTIFPGVPYVSFAVKF